MLGAGVIGLASARLLLQAGFRNVTVVAAEWSGVDAGVTSDGAAAFWERRSDAHKRWAKATLDHYHALIAAGLGEQTGVGVLNGAAFHHSAAPYVGYQEDVRGGVRWRVSQPATLLSA